MLRTVALALTTILPFGLVACSGNEPAPAAGRPAASASDHASPGRGAAAEDVLRDPHARLLQVTVVLRHGRTLVTAAWQAGSRRVIVSSDDRFATVTYRRWTTTRARAVFGGRVDPEPGVLGGLVTQPVATVGSTGEAMVGGGDGATLLPFEAAARRDGTRWRRYAVPRVAGELAYVDGAVVLPDGRLLALLDHWSGDRGPRASAPHHGLWISHGDDWGSYSPYRPRFVPGLRAARPRGASSLVELGGTSGRSGVVWVRTSREQLYVSRDGRTFEEEPTRPMM